MVQDERGAWAGLVISVIGMSAYVVVLLQRAAGGPLVDVDWLPVMLWTIGLNIAASIVVSIAWGIVARAKDPEADSRSDIRDRDIARMGARVEHAFLVIAGLAVIALCAMRADVFWIANAMFAGFAISAIMGGVARVIAYRRGLV